MPSNTAHLSLKSSATSGAAFTGIGQATKFVLQFGSIALLARLLTPEDFGVVAIVVSVVALGDVLRDFGLSSASIQARELSHQQRSNLFWINLSIGAALTVLCAGSGPLLVYAFGDARLSSVAVVLAAVFILNGAAAQYRASLIRALRFKWVAAVEVFSMGSGIAVAAILAIGGAGYWSLVVQQLVAAGCAVVLFVLIARWKPANLRRRQGTRALVNFGGNLMLAQITNYVSRNIDLVVVGSQFGATAAGIYSRPSQLITSTLNQVNAPASTVAVPILSRLQDERQRYEKYLVTGQSALLGVLGSVFVFCVFFADGVVELLLGSQWIEATAIFRWLSLAAVFQALSYSSYWGFVTQGKTKQLLRYALVTRSLSCALIVLGGAYSSEAVAAMYALGSALTWPVGLFWCAHAGHLPVRRLLKANSGLITLIAAGVWLSWLLGGSLSGSAIARTLLGAGFYIALLLLVVLAVRPIRVALVELVRDTPSGKKTGASDAPRRSDFAD